MEFLQNTAEDLNDPDWGETSAEYFFTREETSASLIQLHPGLVDGGLPAARFLVELGAELPRRQTAGFKTELAMLACISGARSPSVIALLSLSITVSGVRAGASSPLRR